MKKNKVFYREFHLAGRQYHDVDEVWDQLKVGLEVKLMREPDNRYDPDAVAVILPCGDVSDEEYYTLGYVPRSDNDDIARFLEMGWEEMFECRISRISPEEHYENQIHLTLRIKRNKMR
ncbi:MAG: HIRAN domain-containing protein [Bacteroidales bacterium]|nr:HIRAN domain-containing protein [Bacteroidales bacterium]